MMAANPGRVGGGFAEEHLQALVETVTRVCNNALLQIVNYNVEGWQYVLAGELIALEVTTQVLNYVKKNNIKVADVSQVLYRLIIHDSGCILRARASFRKISAWAAGGELGCVRMLPACTMTGTWDFFSCLTFLIYEPWQRLPTMLTLAHLPRSQADLDKFVSKCYEVVCTQREANNGRVALTRGFATIPLPGIDVPFHSRFLLSGPY